MHFPIIEYDWLFSINLLTIRQLNFLKFLQLFNILAVGLNLTWVLKSGEKKEISGATYKFCHFKTHSYLGSLQHLFKEHNWFWQEEYCANNKQK